MGFPVITYNSKSITLDINEERIQIDPARDVLGGSSVAGVKETLNVRTNSIVRVSFIGFQLGKAVDETTRRQLEQWWSWAQTGQTWTFARDAAKASSTTLSGSEAAGQTVIGVASSTGFAANDFAIIRSATHQELVKIATVDSSTQVTITETLNHSYASASRFRHEEYWSGKLIHNRNPMSKDSRVSWRFDLEFVEDVNSL